ncbi:MAG: anti-sigma factor family protein [Acidimicrobiales bacterium]
MNLTSMVHLDMFRKKGGVTCLQVARILQRYLDDQLDEGAAAQVADHLDECRRCGLDAESYREVKVALASRARPPSPDQVKRLSSFVAELVSDGNG